MKKRIYRNMFALAVISVILTTILLMLTFYNVFNKQLENEVRTQAIFLQKTFNISSDNLEYLKLLKLTKQDFRLSLINEEGIVIYDSFEKTENMENHYNRPEIKEAFEKGFGQSTRFSNTLGEKTFYYAMKLHNNTVLRLAKTTNSVYEIIKSALPTIFIVILINFLLSNIIAMRLTKRIVEPINKIDLTEDQSDIYDELTPFIKTIKIQKHEIYKQFLTLEDRSNTIKAITENMKEGILILDKNGLILLVNNSVLDFFHANDDNYIGKNTLEFIRNIELQNSIKKALLGVGCDLTINFDNKIVQVFLSPVFTNGNMNGIIALFLDITAKANTEKMRKEFSANVSHELKTPLTIISGYAEMINNDMVKQSDVKNFAGKIKDESVRLITLIEDIIKISELDESTNSHQFVDFDLRAVAVDVVNQLKPLSENKNIIILISGNKKIINANNQMIFEMIYNLVENAIKYNKVDGHVTISIESDNSKTKIQVIDDGIGISSEHLDRIFERFYRVDKSRSKKTGGTGLGLSIVKHIVEYHGGTIDMESVVNVGSKITVVL